MPIEVVVARPGHEPILAELARRIAAEEAPDDPGAPEQGAAGLRQSLAVLDWLQWPSFYLLLALDGGEPVGYLAATATPKLDARNGFLVVDDLYILQPARRRGAASALLERAFALARERQLAGVRLNVRLENAAALALYARFGFQFSANLFAQAPLPAD